MDRAGYSLNQKIGLVLRFLLKFDYLRNRDRSTLLKTWNRANSISVLQFGSSYKSSIEKSKKEKKEGKEKMDASQ